MRLGQRVQRVDDAAVEQSEVARVERDVDVGEPAEDAVEELVGAIASNAVVSRFDPLAVDDVVALRQRSTNSGISSGGSCRSPSSSTTASPVAIRIPLVNALCEPKLRAWLMTTTLGSRAGELGQDLSRVVRAAVVDEDDLVVGAELAEHACSAARA